MLGRRRYPQPYPDEASAAAGPAVDLEVAVAAMGLTDPGPLVSSLGLDGTDTRVLVINQVPGGPLPPPIERGPVRMLSFDERGVARSRNRALEHAGCDVVLLADDDVRCLPEAMPAVLQAFRNAPTAAAITFRFRDSDTGKSARRYPSRAGHHSPLSVASVMSVEVALRPALLGTLRFDERFGLGAPHPSGEEAILLCDLLRAGGVVRHAPVTVCEHPGHGSGHARWDAAMARTKGAVLRRMYPTAWPAMVSYMVATKSRTVGAELGALGLLRAMTAGALGPVSARHL